MRRFVWTLLMLLVAGACAAPVGPTASGSGSGAPSPAALASPVPVESVVESPAASLAPESLVPVASDEPSHQASDEPSDEPSVSPTRTPRPATPKPSPTLNWDANGCTGSIRDPVDLGAKARVFLGCPVGPTCTLEVTYPSGAHATIPKATHPDPGEWLWIWTIPESAGAGKAVGETICTYAGDPHEGAVTFKIVDPTPPGWSISVSGMPATRSITETEYVQATITVNGTFPIDPERPTNYIACSFDLSSGSGNYGEGLGDAEFAPGDPPFWVPITFDGLSETYIGTGTWTIRCRSVYVADSWESDSGTIEITP